MVINMEYVTLNNGIVVNQFGMGTYGIDQGVMKSVVTNALDLQYRMFDTAPNYGNDISLGKAIKNSSVDRNNICIIEKLDTDEQHYSIESVVERCLKRLGIEYIDMYLIHWPYPRHYIKTWKQMEKIHETGLIKTIGVCNFKKHHLEPLLKKANIIPAVNQLEIHPLYTQQETVDFCEINGIKIMAYSPLARMHPNLIDNDVLIKLAKKYEKTVPQIILRWGIQRGFIVIPKSEDPIRIKQNLSIFCKTRA